jgi:alkanesulfonate monooxygenase SsuD/methylene tetrahydromethanopterin reductase-like flavin-dependent oxidoreductase (luciferase family)
MKFGLSLSGLLQNEANSDMVQRFRDVLDLVRLARELGFEYVYTGHHYLTHPYQMMQPLVALSRISAETGEMDLVTTILMPHQNPVRLAEEVATLDAITNGHVIIAAALGYRDEEYEAFGVSKQERIPRMLEAMELMKLLWSGEEVTFHGQFTSVTGVHLGMKPVQQPHPRMWMTANGDGMVRRIGRMGYTWYLNPHAPFDTLARQVEMYKAVRAEAGHGPAEVMPMSRETFVAETKEKAVAIAKPFLESKYQTYAAWGQDKALPGEEDFTQSFEELSQGRFMVGAPDDVIADLSRFRDIGVTHASLRFGWPGTPKDVVEGAMRLAAKEVLPALR